ncbi:aspartyl-tRNA synthetase [Bacillus sp. SA1-12]|uniref:aspartate--tRNA(Asn) ligase n=1 Tax=Bacillus sp. SA1-12 TaxID=1455638 RepID=UPI000626466A|nr:aspartate--tRNA(Asn) ligase [Bacillus sp. SA1-12]KKI92822.1 aspartyl-tRNA synthetase [Bacillus sp. SA1-12]
MDGKKRILISECKSYLKQTVTLKGWVHRVRHLGNISFLLLKDRSGEIQCVLEQQLAGYKVENESAVQIKGIVQETSKQKNRMEILIKEIDLLSPSARLPFEVNKKEINAGLEIILNNRMVSLRNNRTRSIFKIKSELVKSFSDFLRNHGFTQIFTPKIVAQGAEGGADVFNLDYFGKEAFLAQSPQFYKQSMMAAGLERVFEVAPVYRAEEHNSSRHLNEYISLDLETAFIENMDELMQLEIKLLNYMFSFIQEQCKEELELLEVKVTQFTDIPKLTLKEAQEILLKEYKKESPPGDLDTEGEKLIGQYIEKNHQSEFVFITKYPKENRPMYTMPCSENPALTNSFDLLYKGLEITSGGQRIHNKEMLIHSFKEKGLSIENFSSYVDLFNYGVPPHGGFAIGLERLTAKLLGLTNVREASAFPRDINRLTP